MAYKNIRKINRMTKELTEKNNAINAMKSEIEQIDNLKEYNEAVIKLNKKIDKYNEKRRQSKRMIEVDM